MKTPNKRPLVTGLSGAAMPKHRHGPHRISPAGLHLVHHHIEELRRRGAPDDVINDILDAIKDKLPKVFSEDLTGGPDEDAAMVIGKRAASANSAALDLLSHDGLVLVSGEMPPHIMCALLDIGIQQGKKIRVVQIHNPSPHSHRPPHFRDMEGWYPDQFTGVLEFTDIVTDSVKVILLDAFMPGGDPAYVCPLALMATRLWPKAKVVAVLSDHRAPHHLVELRREVDEFLFWE